MKSWNSGKFFPTLAQDPRIDRELLGGDVRCNGSMQSLRGGERRRIALRQGSPMSDATDMLHDPSRLVPLLDGTPATVWTESDLTEMLRHQLTVPLDQELARLPHADPMAVARLISSGGVRSFGDLLHHPSPPLELLQLAKDFAKAADSDAHGPLPPPIATVLYFATIAAGLLRHGLSISGLHADALRTGLMWVCAQPWPDEPTRAMCRAAANAPHRPPNRTPSPL